MSDALIPCPFCGQGDVQTYYIRDGRVTMCRYCGAKSGSQFNGPTDIPTSDHRAIAAWNTRATDAAIAALITASKAMKTDMLERAQVKVDVIHGEEYRIVNAGNSAWAAFCRAVDDCDSYRVHDFHDSLRAAIATDLSSPVVRASVIIAAPTLAAVLGIVGETG